MTFPPIVSGQERPTCVVAITTFLWLCCTAASTWGAHPVSITVAYVYVSEETVSVQLQVFLEDLYLFHDLETGDSEFLERDVIAAGIELHKKFVRERLVIRDAAGEPLAGRVVQVQEEQVPSDGVPLSALMAHQVTFELEYSLASPPDFLTFTQRFTDDEGMLPSEMKLIVRQENAPEAETVVLRPDDLHTARFDWNLPPLGPEASEGEREQWAARQQEEALGITSYSSVYSFLYIENFEVRHEILIPLLTLEQSVLIARDGDEYLDVVEQDAARQQVEAYFETGNPVEIDGQVVAGTVERCDFYGLDFRDFAMRAERKSVPIATARVGIILTYPTRRPPQRVRLTWNRFDTFVWTVNTVVFAFDETIKTSLSRLGDRDSFHWSGAGRQLAAPPQPVIAAARADSHFTIPIMSLLVATAGILVLGTMTFRRTRWRTRWATLLVFTLAALLSWPYAQRSLPNPFAHPATASPEEAEAVFAALHRNLYRAFDYRAESDIYDVLALCTTGDFLQDVYLQIRKGLEMAEQGGAVSRVRDVKILSARRVEPPGDTSRQSFAYRCRWNVAGTVEHWGHIHERTNQYEAIFRIENVNGYWKVSNLQLLDDRRLEFETRLRAT